ncbi:Putative uncharacterized protein [Propionibacterium freudenreichii]|uniref:PD-(D/E)XK motif protein n=2 Tax=Propionibacterium freudenreichii TaxID=1744 RepID=UPI00054343C6|nr:PD-(D/E)XK motif protein [Propionibacterium freudenreichii]CEH04362.1 Putative uncharacterized protein [Propionibacterium freudenreichii]
MATMSDSYGTFSLLLGTIDRDPAVTLSTVPALPGDGLRLGADPGWHRHILAKVPDNFTIAPRRDASTELAEWTEPGTNQRFLDLICRDDALGQVFSALADSVIESIEASEEPPHEVLLHLLDQWRRLFRPAKPFSDKEMRSIFGRLWMLSLLAERNPLLALERWMGSRGEQHDFVSPRGQLQVQSIKRDGQDVTISSLSQLDSIAGVSLVLVRLHVELSPDGQNIGDMVTKLVGMGCPRATVVEAISAMGYLVGVDADESRFIVPTPPIAWHITDDFPGLRSSDVSEKRRAAITKLSYSLDLEKAPGRMSPKELNSFLDELVSQ